MIWRYGVLLLVPVGLWFGLRVLEQHSLFIPDRELFATPALYKLSYEPFSVKTADGEEISGWFIPGTPGAPTLFFQHGNAGNISHRLEKVKIWHDAGLSVCLYDYRGFGRSTGSPTEKGTYLDADAVYDYLTTVRHIASARIVIIGESLGCAVAVETALRHPSAALILESPFTSTLAMSNLIFPWIPARYVIRYHYDNLAKIPQVHVPVMIMHSPTDEVVPFTMGQQLFVAANKPKYFYQLVGGHNDGFERTGQNYRMAIVDFLKSTNAYEPRVFVPSKTVEPTTTL